MRTVNALRRRVRAALAGDRGSASVELVVAVPLLLLLLMAIVQFALWSHATHVAQAAATQGLAATRVDGGTTAVGREATHAMLTQLAGGPLHEPSVAVDRGAVTARVRVEGTAAQVIPFLVLPVTAEASGPIEVLQ